MISSTMATLLLFFFIYFSPLIGKRSERLYVGVPHPGPPQQGREISKHTPLYRVTVFPDCFLAALVAMTRAPLGERGPHERDKNTTGIYPPVKGSDKVNYRQLNMSSVFFRDLKIKSCLFHGQNERFLSPFFTYFENKE